MKKNIIVYAVSVVALVLARALVYSVIGNINLLGFAVLNLVLPFLIIIAANAVIHYSRKATIKSCLVHAVILALLSMVINLSAAGIAGDQVIDDLVEAGTDSNEGPDQEILDELDRLARQKMIEEGLISEDEVIYSEPYMVHENTDGENGSSLSGEQLTGTWDVQIEKENMLSTITGVFLDILLAFGGGVAGMKLRNRGTAD